MRSVRQLFRIRPGWICAVLLLAPLSAPASDKRPAPMALYRDLTATFEAKIPEDAIPTGFLPRERPQHESK